MNMVSLTQKCFIAKLLAVAEGEVMLVCSSEIKQEFKGSQRIAKFISVWAFKSQNTYAKRMDSTSRAQV